MADQPEASVGGGEGRKDIGCRVGAAVVHEDDLEGRYGLQGGERLGGDGLDVLGFVQDGDDHRRPRGFVRRLQLHGS